MAGEITRSELNSLKSDFETGDILTQDSMSDLIDSIPASDDGTFALAADVPAAPTSSVTGSTSTNGIQVSSLTYGPINNFWCIGAATEDINVTQSGVQVATATDFPQLATYLGDPVSVMGFVYDPSTSGVASMVAFQFSASGIMAYPATGSAVTIASGSDVQFLASLILVAASS